ncbi:immunity 52 family protein [Archangium violaceum]|uniref:immunity 52 family protein n=1 Tax=Archangium violaceum TaxID=83451 RepID=UPI00194EE165|nr:immunity 52 family protein [Archangium violaceum]QRN99298.1 immunity 52 family protein [Archangium violaceum]
MSETYGIKAYWARRPESAEECARRAEMFFRLLAECHPNFAQWYEKSNSARKALQLGFEPTRETFLGFFGLEKYQSGKDGFRFGAWTGREAQDQGAMVMLRCGSKAEVAPNNLWLFLPEEAQGHELMLSATVIASTMRAIAVAWEPEWAVATADGLWDELSGGSRLGCFVGWMTYFSRERGEVPALPAPVCVERVGDKGTLVTLIPERLTSSNPEHVALAWRTQKLLEDRGLFRLMVHPPAMRKG